MESFNQTKPSPSMSPLMYTEKVSFEDIGAKGVADRTGK